MLSVSNAGHHNPLRCSITPQLVRDDDARLRCAARSLATLFGRLGFAADLLGDTNRCREKPRLFLAQPVDGEALQRRLSPVELVGEDQNGRLA